MSLKKNFIYNTVYQLFILVLPLITVPYISRVLGPKGVGNFSYTASYAQYFILIGMFGISLYGNRQVAYIKNDKKKLSNQFWNIYLLQFTNTILALILYYIIFLGLNTTDRALYLAQSIPIIATMFDISWFFIGYEDMKSVVVRNTIAKIIGVILIFILVNDINDVIMYAIIMGSTTLVGQLVMWLNIKNKVYFVRPTFRYAVKHLKPALALFISQLAIQVYTLLDKTMLGLITNESQVGLYDNSQKMIRILISLVCSLGIVMLPRMSALYSEGKIDEFKNMIYKSFSFVNFLSFPIVFGLMSVADGFSIWFYGPQFDGVEILLKIGSLIILAISWSNILGIQIMLPMKKEKQFTISVMVGAVVNFIINIILIWKFKAIGSTIASVIAEISVTIVQLYFLKGLIDIQRIFKTMHKPIIGSILMFLIVSILQQNLPVGIVYTIIQASIGAVVYFVMMYIVKEENLLYLINQISSKILKRR